LLGKPRRPVVEGRESAKARTVIVAGLGNPGSEYVGTRHNVGFEVVDALAEKLGWCGPGEFDRLARSKFDALTFDGGIETAKGNVKLLLMKPMTYMNLSGRSLAAAARFYKVKPDACLVILDELQLPAGVMKLKANGSDGGHNGLKSVAAELATKNYPRLRLGIDPPPPRHPGKDYVLGKFTPEQRPKIDDAVKKATAAVVTWADQGAEAAMNAFNGS
jgi:PTH1 family peptidyl-tRNA hydrolase